MRAAAWTAQLGILVVHNDPVVEAELWAMAPPGVTVHSARFESPTATGAEYTEESWARMIAHPDVARGLTQLGQMDLTAICLCFASASFFGGRAFDEGFASAARELTGGTPVYTAGDALVRAMTTLSVRRPMVFVPPWFTGPTFDATTAYLKEGGFEVAGFGQFDLGAGWEGGQRHRLFDRGGRWVVDPENVSEQVVAQFPAGADGVLIPGSGFRSWAAVDLLEQRLGVPVVTSNQACLWRLLSIAELDEPIAGGGRLLTF